MEVSSPRSAFLSLILSCWAVSPSALAGQFPETGQGLYQIGCAKCHGNDGRGVDLSTVGFDIPLPDFSDCSFASREQDADWLAVAHQGGPVRGFSSSMPAFGEAFSIEQIQRTTDFIRSFCTDPVWPRGELNLPRALVTEKAYPEDEAVWTTAVTTEGEGAVINEIVYERRFGARNQIELKLPLGVQQTISGGDWNGGVGDLAVGVKRALFHGLEEGSIVSVGAEAVLPTGDEDQGFGKGTVVFEPFVAFGQILPADAFLHAQAGLEVPAGESDTAEQEAFWRLVVGRTFTPQPWGRTWSPMLEVLATMELEEGAVDWDLLPQIQVSLNKRQHILANIGVRVPATNAATRDTAILFYILWDWFDGGLSDGW